MIVREEKQSDLEIKQMKVIDNLQEEIKLLKYDISRNLSIIKQLKETLKRRNQIIEKVREELSIMKRQNNYENINNVLFVLREMDYEKN